MCANNRGLRLPAGWSRREADFADRGFDVALGLDCEIATIREERSGRSPFCEVATAPTGRQAWIKS